MPKDPKKKEEYLKLLSQKATGRVFSDEHRKKLSEAKIKNPVKYWQNKSRHEYARKHYLENKEKRCAYNKKWRAKNKEKLKQYDENWKINRLKRLETQAGRIRPEYCEVCGKKGRICFDHCHKTGNFRGWICEHCNVLLGFAGDDIKRLELLINYLKIFHAERLNEETPQNKEMR